MTTECNSVAALLNMFIRRVLTGKFILILFQILKQIHILHKVYIQYNLRRNFTKLWCSGPYGEGRTHVLLSFILARHREKVECFRDSLHVKLLQPSQTSITDKKTALIAAPSRNKTELANFTDL